MTNFIKLIGKRFKAYVPEKASLYVEYDNDIAKSLTVMDISGEEYCLINGRKYFGIGTSIFLDSDHQIGSIKQNCEVIQKNKGSLNVGDKIFVSNWQTIVFGGRFTYQPLEPGSDVRGEYIMQIIPDYTEILNAFLESNPDIDTRITSFLKLHPHFLDTFNDSIINTSPEIWKDTSDTLKKDDEEFRDFKFLETHLAGSLGTEIAKLLVRYIREENPQNLPS